MHVWINASISWFHYPCLLIIGCVEVPIYSTKVLGILRKPSDVIAARMTHKATLLKIRCFWNTFRGARLHVPVWHPRGVQGGAPATPLVV